MKKIIVIVYVLVLFIPTYLFSQEDTVRSTFEAGIRCKKFTGFYWENGISAEYKSSKLLDNKLGLGVNLTTSILGTALIKNAIPTMNFEVSALYYWKRTSDFLPFSRLNIGLATAHFSSTYANITNRAPLLSVEFGCSYRFSPEFRLTVSGGINAITGNGTKGLGTVYPLFGQFSLFYKLPSTK